MKPVESPSGASSKITSNSSESGSPVPRCTWRRGGSNSVTVHLDFAFQGPRIGFTSS